MRERLIISGMLVQVRAVPKRRSTHISNYQSNERESYEHDETSMTEIPVCPRECFSSYKTLFRLVPCYKRDWPLAAPLLLLVTCYFSPATFLLELCPRGNNKYSYYYNSCIKIIVYYPCYNCIDRKLRYMCGYIDNTMSLVSL